MNNRNFQRELDDVIRRQTEKQEVPSLLLHCCCAPCSSYVLEYLTQFFRVSVYFYNPNIYPPEEYTHRIDEIKRFVGEFHALNKVRVIEGEYDPQRFYETVKGHEKDPEGGGRCALCFRLRLEASARIAKEYDFDYFTTTLTISPLKNAAMLNAIGEELGNLYGVPFLPSDFKKKGGYLRSIELSKIYNLYRQNYCGCVYSFNARNRT